MVENGAGRRVAQFGMHDLCVDFHGGPHALHMALLPTPASVFDDQTRYDYLHEANPRSDIKKFGCPFKNIFNHPD